MASASDFLRRAVAETRAGFRRSYDAASQPGRPFDISPFEAGAVSPAAALLKIGTSIFAEARARANERRKMELEGAQRESDNLRRDYLTEQIAAMRAKRDAPPEETFDLTLTPRGDMVDANMTGPLEPGTQTIPLKGNEYATRVAAIRSGERADERLKDTDARLGLAERRLQLSEEAGIRSQAQLDLARTREGRARDLFDLRRRRLLKPDPLKMSPTERADLDRAEEEVAWGREEEEHPNSVLKNIYLAMIRDGRAAEQPEDFARSLLDNPALRDDPELSAAMSALQFPEGYQRGEFMKQYRAHAARADSLRRERAGQQGR